MRALVIRLSISILLIVGSMPLLAEEPASVPTDTSTGHKYEIPNAQTLYLELLINYVNRGMYEVQYDPPHIWVDSSILTEIGFKDKFTEPRYDVTTLKDVGVEYDEVNQQLRFTADDDRVNLPISMLGIDTEHVFTTNSSPGALISYDSRVNYNEKNNRTAMRLLSEARAFGHNMELSTSQIVRYTSDEDMNSVRYNTYLDFTFPEDLFELRLGDTISHVNGWSRPVRLGGIQFGRNYSLNPFWNTQALPEFYGSVTVPSTIDLYINDVKRFDSDVPVGPFAIQSMPSINGFGYAQMVITDALGNTQTIESPIFVSQKLIKKGLFDWSFEMGAVRQQYGIHSFDYDSQLASSGVMRYGLTNSLTLDAQAESVKDGQGNRMVEAGIGAAAVPFPILGEFSGFYSNSDYKNEKGQHWGGSYRWSNSRFNFGLSRSRTDDKYTDIAAIYDEKPIKSRTQVFSGVDFQALGSLGVNYIEQDYHNEFAETKLLNVSWFHSLSDNSMLNIGYNRNMSNDSQWGLYVGFNIAFDENKNFYSHVSNNGEHSVYNAELSKRVEADGGLAWRTGITYDEQSPKLADINKRAEMEYLGRHGEVSLGVSSASAAYAGVNGALVMMDNSFFLTRRIDDAFAIVDTNGVENVPVLIENRLTGYTDKSGKLLVTPLYSYQNNAVSIDTLQLPPGYHIENVNVNAVPSRRSGILVKFPIAVASSALITIRDESGEYLPMGSRLYTEGNQEPVLVGYEGQAYLENLSNIDKIEAMIPNLKGEYSKERVCTIIFDFNVNKATDIQKIDNVVCRK